ncbi:MAG: cell division protein FtsQ/DivIB [Burkholderiaceae bacterium]
MANALFALVLLATLAAALLWISQRPLFTVRAVEVEAVAGAALRHVDTQRVVRLVRRVVHGNFFSIGLDSIRAEVETLPWVRRAQVRKLWPDRIVIGLEEHRAAALWETGRLLNDRGELFDGELDRAEVDGVLPQLGGPLGAEREVLERYQAIARLIEPIGRSPVSVTLSPRRAWRAQLDDGTVLQLGRENDERTERKPHLDRIAEWVSAYPMVLDQLHRRAEVVDLRYPNGFAIRSLARLEEEAATERREP